MSPVELGKMLYEKKGCVGLSHDRRQRARRPELEATGLRQADASWRTARSVTMDENYIRESILYPQEKSRPGFPTVDAVVRGQLKDKEIDGLIAYIKSLK